MLERIKFALDMLQDCTEVNPRKCGGKPVLKGTRFTLAQLLAEVADGRDLPTIAEDFDLNLNTMIEFLQGFSIILDQPVFQHPSDQPEPEPDGNTRPPTWDEI